MVIFIKTDCTKYHIKVVMRSYTMLGGARIIEWWLMDLAIDIIFTSSHHGEALLDRCVFWNKVNQHEE